MFFFKAILFVLAVFALSFINMKVLTYFYKRKPSNVKVMSYVSMILAIVEVILGVYIFAVGRMASYIL